MKYKLTILLLLVFAAGILKADPPKPPWGKGGYSTRPTPMNSLYIEKTYDRSPIVFQDSFPVAHPDVPF